MRKLGFAIARNGLFDAILIVFYTKNGSFGVQSLSFYNAIPIVLQRKTIGIAIFLLSFFCTLSHETLQQRITQRVAIARSYVAKNRARNLFFIFRALLEGKYCYS